MRLALLSRTLMRPNDKALVPCLDLYVAVDISFERREIADAVLLAKFVGNGLCCLFEDSMAPQDVPGTQEKVLGSGRLTE